MQTDEQSAPRPLAEARMVMGSWPQVAWAFLLGRPAFRVAAYHDVWFRVLGIPLVAALAHIFNLNLVPEHLDVMLHPKAWLHTLVFTYLMWHISLQGSYWMDARLGVQEFPERLRHQIRWQMLVVHILTPLSAFTHFSIYGLNAWAVVLGAKYYASILVASLIISGFYTVYFLPVLSLRASVFAIQQGQALATALEEETAPSPEAPAEAAPPVPQPQPLASAPEPQPQAAPAAPESVAPAPKPTQARPMAPVRLELVSKTVFLPEDRIEHVFIENRVVFVQTTTGEALVTKYITLAEVEALLSPAFYRASRQLLIHRRTVMAYKRLPNGNLAVEASLAGKNTLLNVSRYKSAAFREWVEGV